MKNKRKPQQQIDPRLALKIAYITLTTAIVSMTTAIITLIVTLAR